MIDLRQFIAAINEIAEEKGIPKERVIETIEMAIAAAYKKDYGKRGQIIHATLDPESGKTTFKQIKIVVDSSMLKPEEEIETESMEEAEEGEIKKVRFNSERHIMIDEAKKIKKDAKPGDEIELPLEAHDDYGRIAAQTAKQVIIQRIREAERESVFQLYKDKEGEIISGMVQRIEGRNAYIDIGRATALLPHFEQIPRERLRIGDRIKAYVLQVMNDTKGAGILLSRTHPNLIKKLFAIEVPEIASGVVEIKAISREAGSRTKVAVFSHQEGVDPVGSCVGQKGVRVMAVISEIGGEKIDIIEWSDDYHAFIKNALLPAKVLDVEAREDRKEARVLVPEDQLSLAIGRGGQNVRLAARLTGWRIDVRAQRGSGEEIVPEDASASPDEATTEEARKNTAEKIETGRKEDEKKIETEKEKKKTKNEEAPTIAQSDAGALSAARIEEKPKKKRSSKKKTNEASTEK